MAKEDSRDSLTEYQQVQSAGVFFKDLFEREKAGLKDFSSLPSLLNLTLNKIYANLLKFVENIIGVRLYTLIDNPLLADVTPKIKSLARKLIRKKIIKKIARTPRIYPDEPWVQQYQIEIATTSAEILSYSDGRGSISGGGGGIDFDEAKAFIKTVGEGMERFCLCVYREKDLLLSSYNKVAKKALNPLSFTGISPVQRQTNLWLKIDKKSIFRWVKGFSLYNNKKTLIPAQLVYIGYKYAKGEPIIQEQISTGAAAADSFEGALCGGICEAVERDAFMIAYLNKLSPPLIDLSTVKDKELQKLLAMFKRYNLEIYAVDITTDIAIPSVLAVIIDRTGVGPVVHLGAKTNLNIKEAVSGAICEVLRGRLGFRGKVPLNDKLKKKQGLLRANPSQIMMFEDRFLFWESLDMIKDIEFLLQGPEKKIDTENLDRYKNFSDREKLKASLKILKKADIDVYGTDIATPQMKEEEIFVAKVVSPQLQPLYLNEGIRHSWGDRLFNVPVRLGYRGEPLAEKDLNQLPHPFL